MHLDDVPAPGARVQRVDVLGHDGAPRGRAVRARRARRAPRSAGVTKQRGCARGRSSRRARDRAGTPGSTRPRTDRPSAQIPVSERKSGIPDSVDTPAPVSTTHGCRSRMSAASAAADIGRIVGLTSWRASRSRPTCGSASPRQTRRASRTTRRSSCGSRSRASRTWREHAGGYQAIRDRGHRGADDGGAPALPPRRLLRRDADGLDALHRRCAAPGSPTSTGSSATASSSLTATRGTRPSIARRIARRAFRRGSPRRSLRPRLRRRSSAVLRRRLRVLRRLFAPGFGFFGSTFVPIRTTRSSPSYDVVHVSERMSSPLGRVDLSRRRRARRRRPFLLDDSSCPSRASDPPRARRERAPSRRAASPSSRRGAPRLRRSRC